MLFHDLETKRLLLRSISFDDRDFILQQFSDAMVNRYLLDAEPMADLSEADELIRFYMQPEPRAQHRWILILKEGHRKIGTCGFHRWNREQRRAEVGYDLQPAYWGQGLMSEALSAILPFAAEQMGVCAIDAHIYEENERSACLAQKLGFAKEGRTIPYSFHGATYVHSIYTFRPVKLRVTDQVERRDRDEIFEGLLAYNLARLEDIDPKELGVYDEDAQGRKRGGLIAETHGNWLTVNFLWVAEPFRGQHIGSALLEQAERTAAERGCRYAFLDTFGFQAPDFYRKHGYTEVFALEHYPRTGKRHYFVKELTKEACP